MPKETFQTTLEEYLDLIDNRKDYEAEWKDISEYLLPGRGIFQLFTNPQKRTLTSKKVINNSPRDAMSVLTAEFQSRLTSPARPWFSIDWDDKALNDIEILRNWIPDAQQKMIDEFNVSDFYSSIMAFYDDLIGFGTGSMFVGASDGISSFRFEPLTVGEYAIAVNHRGLIDHMYRTIFLTPYNMVQKYGESKVSEEVKRIVKDKSHVGKQSQYVIVLECVKPEKFQDKAFTQYHFEYGFSGSGNAFRFYDGAAMAKRKPLEVKGFHEFPYPTGRWSTISADVYGLGLGSKALNDIKRLQEQEKAFLMAVHKSVDPPLNIPFALKGRIKTLPGGKNYHTNPSNTVTPLFDMRFDYAGVEASIQRIEQRIQRTFFNDLFFTSYRDPNATPYKATEVAAREREKMTRLGPVVERLQHEFFIPLIERCFNIMLRQGKFAQLPPNLIDRIMSTGGFKINMISPLAQAQKLVALSGIQDFLVYVGQTAQFDQTVLDKVDADNITDEMAEITGVASKVLRTEKEVKEIRENRAIDQQNKEKMQMDVMRQQLQLDMQNKQADIGVKKAKIMETSMELTGNA